MHTIITEQSAGRRIINLGSTSNGRYETTAGREYDVGLNGGIKKGKDTSCLTLGRVMPEVWKQPMFPRVPPEILGSCSLKWENRDRLSWLSAEYLGNSPSSWSQKLGSIFTSCG